MSLSQKIADAVDDSRELPGQVSAEDGTRRLSIVLSATGPVGLRSPALICRRHSPRPRRMAARATQRPGPTSSPAADLPDGAALAIIEHDLPAGVLNPSKPGTHAQGRSTRSFSEIRIDRARHPDPHPDRLRRRLAAGSPPLAR